MFIRFFKKSVVGLNLVLLILGLAGIEGALIIFFPQSRGPLGHVDSQTGLRWNIPGDYWIDWPGSYHLKIHFNQEGLRESPTASSKLEGAQKRVLVLGGSIANGFPENVSFVDSLTNYNVTNCSMTLVNLATLILMSQNQCRTYINSAPDYIIVQLNVSPFLRVNSLYSALSLFFGENLIEEPALFYADPDKNISQISAAMQFRDTGVPFLDATVSDLREAPLRGYFFLDEWYERINFYRFFSNRIRDYHYPEIRAMIQRTNRKMFDIRFKSFPDQRVAIKLFQKLQALAPNSKIIALFIPDFNGMVLTNQRQQYLDLLKKDSNYRPFDQTYSRNFAPDLSSYLTVYSAQLQKFQDELGTIGISVADQRDTFLRFHPEQIFFSDRHHFHRNIQAAIAEDLNHYLQ